MLSEMTTVEGGVCLTVFIGTSAIEGWHRKSTFAWRIERGDGSLFASSATMPVQQIAGDPTKVLHPAVTEAVSHLPAGTTRVLIISNQEHFVGKGRLGIEGRRACNYCRADGEPLADAVAWRELDDHCESRGLTLIIDSPRVDYQTKSMKLVKAAARHNAKSPDGGSVQ